MSMKKFYIVSPPFPSGVTWLVNLLLELKVKVTNNAYADNHWLNVQDEDAFRMTSYAYERLRWYLPGLTENQKFVFSEDIEVLWEHRLDFAKDLFTPTILFVRTPQDAIYSLYKRDHENTVTFEEFLKKPNRWPDHFPDMFDLPPAETYVLFCRFWFAMSKVKPILVVRLEDTKANPYNEVVRILQFLKIKRSDEEIARALDMSRFERVKKSTQNLIQTTGMKFNTARSGKIAEWKETYSKQNLKTLHTASILDTLKLFNYEAEGTVFGKLESIKNNLWSKILFYKYKSQIQDLAFAWNNKVFGEKNIDLDDYEVATAFFYKYLEQYCTVKTIRKILNVNFSATVPRLLKVIKSINIISYAGNYYGIPQSLGAVDFSLSKESLKTLYKNKIFVTKSFNKVIIRIHLYFLFVKIRKFLVN